MAVKTDRGEPSEKSPSGRLPIFFWSALSETKEEFVSIKDGEVGMYDCGPTVYNYVHIGNLRSYVFADTLRRLLEWNGYRVKQVINITDVGHLTSDADIGADKLEEGARRENKSVKDIVAMYTQAFFDDIESINIPREKIIFPKATEHINEQIALIEKLFENGHAYKISDGVYFDISTFLDYGRLGGVKQTLEKNADTNSRIEVNPEKHHPSDFALWKFSKPEDRREQEWPSPWGVGFPGWHIECSAMSMKYLGETFDIHTGGIDHIPIHHNNEIAQSEAATGKPFVHFWLHNAFVSLISGEKMAKSSENFIRLRELIERGINPLAFRYWLLTAHYRSQIEFSFEALEAAENAYKKLVRSIALINLKNSEESESKEYSERPFEDKFKAQFAKIINNDLNTPESIAFIWQILKSSNESGANVLSGIAQIDEVLGLGLMANAELLVKNIAAVPEDIKKKAEKREAARKINDWTTADLLRKEVENAGFIIEDSAEGPILMPN